MGRVRQILHHLDKPRYCAQDTDRWRIATSRFPYLGALAMKFVECIDLHFQHTLQYQRLRAIDHQLQSLFHERIIDALDVQIQGEESLFARSGTPDSDMLYQGRCVE